MPCSWQCRGSTPPPPSLLPRTRLLRSWRVGLYIISNYFANQQQHYILNFFANNQWYHFVNILIHDGIENQITENLIDYKQYNFHHQSDYFKHNLIHDYDNYSAQKPN